jgi:hypothetical protein
MQTEEIENNGFQERMEIVGNCERMNRQNVEVVDEFNYSGVTLEDTGCLNR